MVLSRGIREWNLEHKSGLIIMVRKYRHITIQRMPQDDLRTTTTINPQDFAFFKGLNQPAGRDGVLTQNISSGLKAGSYRMCSINASMSHAPVIGAIAQRGSHDDCIYVCTVFEIGEVDYSCVHIPSVHGETQATKGQATKGQATKGQATKGQQCEGRGNRRSPEFCGVKHAWDMSSINQMGRGPNPGTRCRVSLLHIPCSSL